MGLLNKLKALDNEQVISMHVPGHKNLTIGYLQEINIKFDMTELPGLDNLHDPEDILLELNQHLSGKYEGYYAQALVNGSTTGIMASIFAMYNEVNHFYIVNDAHKSVYHALELLNAPFSEIECKDLYNLGESCGVIITHPTYLGEAFKNLEDAIHFIHSNGSLVVVDEAHGAHNDIAEGFLASSMNYEADYVVQSYHKMLPALTGASVVFVNDKDKIAEVKKYVDYFETSSPSYLIMASIELAHEFYNHFTVESFEYKRRRLINTLLNEKIKVTECDDPAKLLLYYPGMKGSELEYVFRDMGIYAEMTAEDTVLWCLPLFHKEDSYPFGSLIRKISNINLKKIRPELPATYNIDVLLHKKCVRTVVPYPPGVPLVLEGDKFRKEEIERLHKYLSNHVKIEGIKENINYYMNEEK